MRFTQLVLLAATASASTLVAPASTKPAVKLLSLRGGGPVPGVATVKTPKETYAGMAQKGADNAKLPLLKTLHQSIMGGCYVGMGGLLSIMVAGNCPGIAETNPGMQKFIFAALFPVNLLLILMSGGQLFTGNSAAVPAALYEGLVGFDDLAKSWVVSYIGNIIGCGLFAYAAKYTGLLTGGPAKLAVKTVMAKCGGSFMQKVVKGIMCNWLVCMAVFLAGSANDLGGKMVGIWFPISTFVAIGLEHSVANLFLLPLGLMGGAELSVVDIILKNLIPVTIGNAIAGAVVVAAGYSYAFGKLGDN
jgi:formate/nitrite transporter